MDDMAGKISELLSDPKGMEKIKAMANALFGESEDLNQSTVGQSKSQSAIEEQSALSNFSLPDDFDPVKLISIFSALKSNNADKRTTLLLALKPHLSYERQERVDKAVKLLKMAALLPVLRQQGILDEIF